jgi:hypothetical protein
MNRLVCGRCLIDGNFRIRSKVIFRSEGDRSRLCGAMTLEIGDNGILLAFVSLKVNVATFTV